jgi:YbgC/YbaW family acyl-CoA thioester hydrolase
MFTIESTVKLYDTDAAGIIFFSQYYKLAHDVYEAFMEAAGWGLNYVISESDILLPIVHSEADYHQSMRLGDNYSIAIKVEKVGQTSFVLLYEFRNAEGGATATVKTVHVAVGKKNGRKIKLPESLREGLLKFT